MGDLHVAVSGITGFLGSHITHDLLHRGYHVHGTMRKQNPDRIKHLTSVSPGTLHVFEADLTIPNSFDDALKDCTYAIHVASPVLAEWNDPQKDVIQPAVQGTKYFLNACEKAGVKKVILTSSTAALGDLGLEGKVYTEQDWNTSSTPSHLPYFYSKTTAEKTAWQFVDIHPDIKLITMLPALIQGPSLSPSIGESLGILNRLASGEFGGIIDLAFAMVDVRDVSEAHIRAMESDTASGRYIVVGDDAPMHCRDFVRILKERGFHPAERDLSGRFATALLKLVSFVFPGGGVGQFLRAQLGVPHQFSNERIKRELGMQFRSAEETVRESVETLIQWDALKDPTASGDQ